MENSKSDKRVYIYNIKLDPKEPWPDYHGKKCIIHMELPEEVKKAFENMTGKPCDFVSVKFENGDTLGVHWPQLTDVTGRTEFNPIIDPRTGVQYIFTEHHKATDEQIKNNPSVAKVVAKYVSYSGQICTFDEAIPDDDIEALEIEQGSCFVRFQDGYRLIAEPKDLTLLVPDSDTKS